MLSAAIAAPTSPLNTPQTLPTATAAHPEVVMTGAPSAMPVDEESSVPILGALPGLLRDAPGTLLDAARRHPGQVFALRLGPLRVPVITPPALVQQVLADDVRSFGKGGMWKAARRFLGNGLVTSEGDFWLRQRRLMQPMFSARYLAGLSQQMISAIDIEVAGLLRRARPGEPVEVGAAMSMITQRVLMTTMFSTSFSEEEAASLGAHMCAAMGQLTRRMFLSFLPEWVPIPGDRAYNAAVKALDEALLRVLRERREDLGTSEDLLARLITAQDAETGERMTDQQIRDELITLFVAGQDTTAGTLAWMYYLLDQHPEVAQRMYAEIDAVLGERPATIEDLPRLAYTRQVLQEVMRLYPSGFLLPRFTTQPTMLGSHAIAANTPVLLSAYLTHRDKTVWERPDDFDPERFAPANQAGRHRYAYFPFGGGGRQCIGNHFAMMEAQLIVAKLARLVRPRLVPGQKIVPAGQGTLKPRNGMMMRLERI